MITVKVALVDFRGSDSVDTRGKRHILEEKPFQNLSVNLLREEGGLGPPFSKLNPLTVWLQKDGNFVHFLNFRGAIKIKLKIRLHN